MQIECRLARSLVIIIIWHYNMFNTSKLQKKAGLKASELEEELAKTLQHFE